MVSIALTTRCRLVLIILSMSFVASPGAVIGRLLRCRSSLVSATLFFRCPVACLLLVWLLSLTSFLSHSCVVSDAFFRNRCFVVVFYVQLFCRCSILVPYFCISGSFLVYFSCFVDLLWFFTCFVFAMHLFCFSVLILFL